MPTSTIELPPAGLDPPRKRWTRAEYDALSACGVLHDEKLELLEGELISKMGKKRPHVISLRRLMYWLARVFGEVLVSPETPIDVAPADNPTNQLEPDIVVLKRDLDVLTSGNPRPEDLQLVVEISETTPAFDLTTKAALYARAGIIENWVLDIPGRRMIVHRDPQGERYRSIAAYSSEESVAPLTLPSACLPVGDVLI